MSRLYLFCMVMLLALTPTWARADSLAITLTVNFTPPSAIPNDPCFGSTCTLSGTAQFYLAVSGPNIDVTTVNPFGAPIAINGLAGGQSFISTFYPTDPCFGQTMTCELDLSFLNGGTTVSGPEGPPIFPTFFFAGNGGFPSANPGSPPIVPLGLLGSNLSPTPPPISQSGSIVAYDAPVVVGTWSVTVAPVPEPASAWLLACGALGLAGMRRRRGRAVNSIQQ